MLLATLLSLSLVIAVQDHDGHDHEAGPHQHQDDHADHDAPVSSGAPITRTAEIEAALSDGGEPVVADVLGVVCDFCAKAMNKTFGKRKEVAAVYVDLDRKSLNLVFRAGQGLSDAEIEQLVRKAGYRIAAIRRGDEALAGGSDASRPA